MKKAPLTLMILLLLISLPGCFLLPEEEQLPSLPLITGEETPEYDYAYAEYGDLIHTEELSCRVVEQQEESLSYSITGETIETVYVAAGDEVTAGDLIAELATDEEDLELAQYAQEWEELDESLTYAQENLAICQRSDALSDQADTYADLVREIEDRFTVLDMRMGELEEDKEAGRLYCTIDGIVTYAKSSGATSIKNTTVATIVTRADSEYYTDTEYYDCLPVGTQVEITINAVPYTAEVTAIEDVPESTSSRRQPSDEEDEDQKRVYLTIEDDDLLDASYTGTVLLLVDSRENVLILPADAVIYSGDQALVYYSEANSGLMRVKEVTVGLTVGDYIEIVSGLSEGDCVIVD